MLIFSIGCFAQFDLNKPNILLIVSDDQGLHDVSYYGTKDIKTPNIDFIAKTGIRIDNFYANSPVCSPTRASIMTGLYPDRAGVPGVIRTNPLNSWGHLRTDVNILPAELKNLGYNSALIGKWHLGIDSPNLPNLRGFDFFHGWLGDMMDDYWNHLRETRKLVPYSMRHGFAYRMHQDARYSKKIRYFIYSTRRICICNIIFYRFKRI